VNGLAWVPLVCGICWVVLGIVREEAPYWIRMGVTLIGGTLIGIGIWFLQH
jgi:hypothetical protein